MGGIYTHAQVGGLSQREDFLVEPEGSWKPLRVLSMCRFIFAPHRTGRWRDVD